MTPNKLTKPQALDLVHKSLQLATKSGAFDLDQAMLVGEAIKFLIEEHNNALAELNKSGENNNKPETDLG